MNHKEYFNEISSSWNNNSLDSEKLKPLLNKLHFEKNESIMDGGTGTGNLIPFLSKITDGNSKIYAIDFAINMTKKAIERFDKINNVIFITADIHNLPLSLIHI